MSQKTYASQILEEFDMTTYTSTSIPMHEGTQLNTEDQSSSVETKKYQRLIGMLIYLCNTNSEIVYVVGVLSRFMHAPKTPLMEAAYQILWYIKGTLDFGIFYAKDHDNSVVDYTDADWANCKMDRKSITW